MFDFLIICLTAGGIGAILQGMVGIGTGIVVIPLLTFLLPKYGFSADLAVHIALTTSMAAIVISSISALISHQKRGNIQWALFKKMLCFSICGAFLGALVANAMPGQYLKMIFGTFMILLAIYMLLKKHIDDTIDTHPRLPLKTIAMGGASIGFVGSIIGAGGSVLMVPFLHAQNLKMRYAVGTATLIGLPVTLVGSFTYIVLGLRAIPLSATTIGYLHWPAFLAISAAGIVAAPFGAKLATVLPTKVLQKIFAACMIIVGIKMVF
jgi:uncharacterized membrane protein YfcA